MYVRNSRFAQLRCRRCLPYLKTCMRGAGWEDMHWASLFSLLGFKPGSVTKETVTLAHFLDKADALLLAADKIKALDAQVGQARDQCVLLGLCQILWL
jgi:hypothetical protein